MQVIAHWNRSPFQAFEGNILVLKLVLVELFRVQKMFAARITKFWNLITELKLTINWSLIKIS